MEPFPLSERVKEQDGNRTMNPIMHCADVEPMIEAYLTVGAEPSADAIGHIRECELCRQRCADAALNRLLLSHSVPPPRPGFVDEVIRNAIDHHANETARRPQHLWMGALAASIIACAIAVGMLIDTNSNLWSTEPAARIALAPQQSKTVRVLIDSIANRDHATITIALADNLELEGFPEDRIIEWETSLKEGKNLLALPLRLKNGANSHFEVAFTDGATRKQLRIDVTVDNPPAPPQVI
jgi:hypothetical protein